MKKLVSLLLALALVLGCTGALAVEEIDYSKYSQFPLVTDGSVTIRVVTHRNDAVGTAVENIWFWPWLEKITGINFEVEQILDSVRGEKFSLMLASDDLPDLIYGMNMNTAELVRYGQSEGLLMPLNEFLTEDIMPNACAWFEAYPQAKGYCTAPDGNMYTMPWLSNLKGVHGEASRIFYNDVWASELGYTEPPKTLEAFTEMLYAMKADRPESIPLGGGMEANNPMYYIMNAMGFLGNNNNYGMGITVKDGEAVLPVGHETFKEVLSLMKQFYEDGIIAIDFFTMDDTKNNAYMSDGTLGVYPSVPFIVNADKEFWDDWCSCTPLTSEYNDKQQWVPADSIAVGNWAVSASSEHGELLARLCDFFFSDIGALLAWFGPMTGTSDCLDMTEGWSFDEETNEIVLGDVVSGKYPSTNEYSHQVGCAVNGGGVGAYSHSLGLSDIPADLDVGNILRYLAGMPIKEAAFNLEQPDPAFRHSMSLHISPYYVSGFPSVVYYDEDTTYAMSDLRAVLNTYVKAEIAKFIVGERSLDEFDTFVSELEGMGLRELEGYYQAAYDSYMASIA